MTQAFASLHTNHQCRINHCAGCTIVNWRESNLSLPTSRRTSMV